MTSKKEDHINGEDHEDMETEDHEEEEEEKKPGTVRRISKITFTIGPIRQEDFSLPELNRIIALAASFSINFDTVEILDTEEKDRLGYVTLPFEIRSNRFLMMLYNRLSKLQIGNRDMSVKFPQEFLDYIEEVKKKLNEQREKRIEAAKKLAEAKKRSVFIAFVDKDSGVELLKEKFPEATEVTVHENKEKEKWYGQVEFESTEIAEEILKENKEFELDGETVKTSKHPPWDNLKGKQRTPNKGGQQRGGGRGGQHRQQNRPATTGGFGMRQPLMGSGPMSLMDMGRPGMMGFGGQMGGGRYSNYGGGGYQGGYGRGGMGGGPMGGMGGYQLGAKRKGEFYDDFGAPKKPFGGGGAGDWYQGGRGMGGGGRGRGNWGSHFF